jgi:hypothetical protein
MAEESKQVQQLEDRIHLLEELLRQVPLLWLGCREEGSFFIKSLDSASHEFLKLVYKIEKAVPPIEQ